MKVARLKFSTRITFLSCMFVVILLTFCIDFVQINMYVCMHVSLFSVIYLGSVVVGRWTFIVIEIREVAGNGRFD